MGPDLHVIFGTGPVGCWIARALRADGQTVRAINRSGKRPELLPAEVPLVKANAADPAQAMAAAKGASVVYQALNPPYSLWATCFPALQSGALAAARAEQARYVSVDNLYMYDATLPISEDSPIVPASRKGALRKKMAEEVLVMHSRGDIRAAILRASDYYGPGVVASAMGERVFGHLVAGRPAQILGSAGMPHSFAYIEDVGRSAAALGTQEAALGQVWIAPHAPAMTQGELVEEACRILGTTPRYRVISPLLMRLAGLANSDARASVEMMYEFTAPFVVRATRAERALDLSATETRAGLERTVAWYRHRLG